MAVNRPEPSLREEGGSRFSSSSNKGKCFKRREITPIALVLLAFLSYPISPSQDIFNKNVLSQWSQLFWMNNTKLAERKLLEIKTSHADPYDQPRSIFLCW